MGTKGPHEPPAHGQQLIQDQLLGEAVAHGGYVVLVADERMRYLAASDAACDLLGYSRDELLRLTVPDLVVETEAAAMYDEFVRTGAQRGRITLRRKDGRHVAATYEARETSIGGLTYYVSMLSPT